MPYDLVDENRFPMTVAEVLKWHFLICSVPVAFHGLRTRVLADAGGKCTRITAAPVRVCGSRLVHVQSILAVLPCRAVLMGAIVEQVSVVQIASVIAMLSVLLSARRQGGQGQHNHRERQIAAPGKPKAQGKHRECRMGNCLAYCFAPCGLRQREQG